MKRFVSVICFLIAGLAIPAQVLDNKRHHLRTGGKAEWDTFEASAPEGDHLEIHFQARTNQTERTLFIDQTDVKWDWHVDINRHRLGTLFAMEYDVVQALAIPPGTLRDGDNTLRILPPPQSEDIIVSKIEIADGPPSASIGQATLQVSVNDEKGQGIPSRITIADSQNRLIPIWILPGQKLAARPGVAYTGTGRALLGVRPGEYIVYATRGFEYGLAKRKIKVRKGDNRSINLLLRREVLLPEYAPCDTHIHTVTFSKHGDASIGERMLTIAGEGLELPVATEHNLQIGYSNAMREMGVEGRFTPIRGNEVTTSFGHFNAFPMLLETNVPDNTIESWPKLMESIRATPGVEVVILNHPRNIHSNFMPFARTNFNNLTGENLRGPEFTFDAIELINSGALRSDLMQVYRDWFGLLNYGYKITAVGASDSHDVSRYIVGQGRTYIKCDHQDPGRIDLKEVTSNLKAGHALVSLGLLTEMTVNRQFKSGDLAPSNGQDLQVNVKIFAPSWISPTNLTLFANGQKVREQSIRSRQSSHGIQADIKWTLPKPRHDIYLVARATGPGVTGPYWSIAKPYQPESAHWEPQVAGSTNPIWVDADGDGRYESPRDYAKRLMNETGGDPRAVVGRLADYDRATALEAASLLHAAGVTFETLRSSPIMESAAEFVRGAFVDYAEFGQPPSAKAPH